MRIRKHLRRLDSVRIEPAIYFITTCVAGRRRVLANDRAFAIVRGEFETAPMRYGWRIGRFAVMPDHVHFFCAGAETAGAVPLSRVIGGFKEWTAKGILRALGDQPPLWQREFFDHVLRSDESYESKWQYVRENPVRAGLVKAPDDWPYGGEIAPIIR